MSHQLRASRFASRVSTRSRASRFEDDYDDRDGAETSGYQAPIAQPDVAAAVAASRVAAAAAASQTDLYGSDWELEMHDSDDDHTYVPPKLPENLPVEHSLSDSEPEYELDDDLDAEDYVRMHDVSMESVPDSDLPLAFRIAREAQVNAPGTDAFRWRRKTPAFIRRGVFLGVYLFHFLAYCFIYYYIWTKRSLHTRF